MDLLNRQEILNGPGSDSVRLEPLSGRAIPILVTPAHCSIASPDWASSNSQLLETALNHYGALLFRGFGIGDAGQFEHLVKTLSGELIEYHERTSPRSSVGCRVYTSTDYPAAESIFPHNESSYNSTFPMKIFFFCETPPAQGGATPIGDTRKIFARINPAVRERLIERKYMYVRNYDNDLGLSWEDVFQTADRSAVEAYCRSSDIEFEWRGEGRLRTRQVRPVAARHPRTGEMVWFNHAAFFHVSTLEQRVRNALLKMVPEEDLPNNTYYGDGSPIEPEVLDELRAAYQAEMVVSPWIRGDILMLDNLLTAHGRQPFTGPRRILTAMSEPCSWKALN